MDFGVATFVTDETVDPAALGALVEDAGLESLFLAEHSHIPTSRETPFVDGGQVLELPPHYRRTLDPFVALTAAAAATKDLRVGTGICLIVERDPIMCAKEVATVDYLSGGRMLFGVGAGWNREEMANHGTDPDTRWRLMRERVEAMKAIWTEDEAAYHGDFVDFDPIWMWPKPVQKPHPPVLVGGNGPTVLDRVLAFGDEWLPDAAEESPDGATEAMVGRIEELQRRAADAGREIPVTMVGAPMEVEKLATYAEAGVKRCVFWLLPGRRDQVERQVAEVRSAIEGLDG